MGLLDSRHALVTGAARGIGRDVAVSLAREGATVTGVDVCAPVPGIGYPMATQDDLAETARLVRTFSSFHAGVVDVGDEHALAQHLEEHPWADDIDIVVINAGVISVASTLEDDEAGWDATFRVNVRGALRTARTIARRLVDREQPGSIVFISSTLGVKARRGVVSYVAAQHAVIGLMRAMAHDLASANVRVNAVMVGQVDTAMTRSPSVEKWRNDGSNDEYDLRSTLPMAVTVEAEDIGNAVAWLASDEARYVTGVALPVDAGLLAR